MLCPDSVSCTCVELNVLYILYTYIQPPEVKKVAKLGQVLRELPWDLTNFLSLGLILRNKRKDAPDTLIFSLSHTFPTFFFNFLDINSFRYIFS